MIEVLEIGDPRLRRVCEPVTRFEDPLFKEECKRLHEALREFRKAHGFGRAIAAPQINIPKRLIAANLGNGPFTLVNPEITWRSTRTHTLWDDCMSFPMLLVRVQRHASISLRFWDETGKCQEWEKLPADQSELFQHEIDHLDGVLATDLALDRDAIVARTVFERDVAFFRNQVSYGPPPN